MTIVASARRPVEEPAGVHRLVGDSSSIAEVRTIIQEFAPTPEPILIVGPTGSGKELCAVAIHELSGRRGPLVPVDCAALPAGLVEGELFGRSRGAYTGADRDARGLMASAHRGTLFLDELSCLPVESQGKLLRTIETGEVRALGADRPRQIEVRVLAAVQWTRDGLTGPVREDLLHRLGGVTLHLLPLRERPEDIEPLARHFAARAGVAVDPGGMRPLMEHAWPGNVRELRAAVRRAATLARGGVIQAHDAQRALLLGWRHAAVPGQLAHAVRADERRRLTTLLAAHQGDTRRVAEHLRVSRATVYRRLSALGIPAPKRVQGGIVRSSRPLPPSAPSATRPFPATAPLDAPRDEVYPEPTARGTGQRPG